MGHIKANSYYKAVSFLYVFIVYALSTLHQGLFFIEDQVIFALLISPVLVGIVIYSMYKKSFCIPEPAWGIFIVITAYMLASINAVNMNYAVRDIVLWCLYLLIFTALSQLVEDKKTRTYLAAGIYLSGVTAAVISLLSALHLVDVNHAFMGNRLYGVFQYANATACYLIAPFMLGLHLLFSASSIKRANLYLLAAGNAVIITALGATRSNGGIIILTAVLALWFVLVGGRERNRFVQLGLFYLVGGLFAGFYFSYFVSIGKLYLAGIILLTAVLLFVLLSLVMLRNRGRLLIGLEIRKCLYIIMSVFFVFIAVITLMLSGVGGIESYLVSQNNGILQLRFHNLLSRLYFFRDALTMISQRPLLGWGGGGWIEAYHAFQSFGYISRQTHSFFIQIWLESGIIGLIGIAAFILMLFKSWFHRLQEKNNEEQQLILAAGLGALAVLMHSTLDFNMSCASVAVQMLMLAAAAGAPFRNKKSAFVNKGFGTAVIALTLLVFVSAFMSYTSIIEARKAKQSTNYHEFVYHAQKAVKYNPFDDTYYNMLAEGHMLVGSIEKAKSEAQKAVEKGEYSIGNRILMVNLAMKEKNHHRAVLEMKKAVKLQPLNIEVYEIYAEVLLEAAEISAGQGDTKKSIEYLNELKKVPSMVLAQAKSITPVELKLWKIYNQMPILDVSGRLKETVKKGEQMKKTLNI
ncbi:O-antigen ligase [Desulfohalotomaculum tongense]|uniref:O-antigen ligase family protein n=1 Tax=Desulforadius tongensis TaxID=1216062 RepID=UPI0019594921|nr:O-antigen ligase family protein [Desulforadius tongensis]MBM7853719.1 O-antigen ligase [Desulforadius tongensis]